MWSSPIDRVLLMVDNGNEIRIVLYYKFLHLDNSVMSLAAKRFSKKSFLHRYPSFFSIPSNLFDGTRFTLCIPFLFQTIFLYIRHTPCTTFFKASYDDKKVIRSINHEGCCNWWGRFYRFSSC